MSQKLTDPLSRERLREIAKRHSVKRGRNYNDTWNNLWSAGILKRVKLKLYVCTACEHVYMGEITRCDCMPKAQEFYQTDCTYFAIVEPKGAPSC